RLVARSLRGRGRGRRRQDRRRHDRDTPAPIHATIARGGDGDGNTALSIIPTTKTVTAPITLCQRNETSGAPQFTAATAPMPQIKPTKAPTARARGIIASRKTPRIEP